MENRCLSEKRMANNPFALAKRYVSVCMGVWVYVLCNIVFYGCENDSKNFYERKLDGKSAESHYNAG